MVTNLRVGEIFRISPIATKSIIFGVFLLASASRLHAIADEELVPRDEVEGRLRMSLQIARERNDRNLVAAVETLGKEFKTRVPKDADSKLRQLEEKVGIDPGGWSMAGQPLFHPNPEMLRELDSLKPRLASAMKTDDAAEVRIVTAAMLSALTDQAGIPDGRRLGSKPEPQALSEADATKLFVDAIATESKTIRPLSEGQLLPGQMVRVYAYVLDATNTIRPFAAQHLPSSLPELDKLTHGVAGILVKLQQPDGNFPFPDLRGKNIRFGDMIQKQIDARQGVVRDGWIVSVDPDGGSQFDTGVCGSALLNASQVHSNDTWKQSGLRAADWALSQECVSNFNYNAFSVSLLSDAFRATGDKKYLDGAIRKFRVGVAPGQAPNGRWIDSHNARTVYHVIILRALGDLASVLPENLIADLTEVRAELDRAIQPAVKTLLDEFDSMGITVEALPELLHLAGLYPEDLRLQKAVQEMAAAMTEKCTDGKRVKMGAQPNQLAAVAISSSLRATLVRGVAENDIIIVRGPASLRESIHALKPGSTLRIAPGDYPGGHYVSNVERLTVEALDPKHPPHFKGGSNGWQFSRCKDLTVRNLKISGQTGNGLNVDDGGLFDQPVTGVTLQSIEIYDIGPIGNHDGIKCSGLERMTIRDCKLTGWGGQGIDMVGCHDSLISGCVFRGKDGFSASAGVQTKGGCSDITIEKCHFQNGGERPLNIGGSTDLKLFRPSGAKYEAKRILVRNNIIEGSPCSAAFVGVDGAEFVGNTILYPEKWIFRILQETRAEGFEPCRNVLVKDNKIVFRRAQVQVELNIGGDTEPETFRFENNQWFAEDMPNASIPKLPSKEKDGIYAIDPR